MKLSWLILKNTVRNPRRTVLTVLSITVSIFLVSTLQAVLHNLETLGMSNSSNLRVVVHRATAMTESMPVSYKQRIAALPGVKYVESMDWFGGYYVDPANFFANFATDVEDFEKIADELVIPPDQLAAWKRERTAALVGNRLMETYHWKRGDRITLKGTIYPVDLEFIIRAVYTDPEDVSVERSVYFHWDYFDESLGRPGRTGSFYVKAATAGAIPRLADTIDGMFRNTDAETKTETEKAFNLSFVSMLGNIKLLLNVVCLVVVFTILLVAGNTMAMSIRERTGEVAVLKTLGFRRNAILYLLVGESVAIALLGGILGALGAKTTYGFIHITSTKGNAFGMLYAAGAALLAAYGTWMLFAGSSTWRTGMKVTRVVVTLLGGLAGLAAGFGFYLGTGYVMNQGGFLADFGVNYGTVALGLGISAGVGLVSALLPALRASKMSIAEALRYVG
jgi:putative ABC transport system permease protein